MPVQAATVQVEKNVVQNQFETATPPKKKRGCLISLLVVLVIVAVIMVSIASCEIAVSNSAKSKTSRSSHQTNSYSEVEAAPVQEPTEPVQSKDYFMLGETSDSLGIQSTLKRAVLSNGNGIIANPDEGCKYLGLIFEISNNSSSDLNLSALASFDAYCDDFSTDFDIRGLASPEWSTIDQLGGTVAPGKKIFGVLTYQVPDSFQKFEVVFKPSVWGAVQIDFLVTADQVERSSIY